jgi:hypothetical protein
MPPSYTATVGERAFQLVMLEGNQVSIDGVVRSFDFVELGSGSFSLILDGRVYSLDVPNVGEKSGGEPTGNGGRDLGSQVCLIVNGVEYGVRVDNEHSLALRLLVAHQADASSTQVVRAPMPGLISRLEVKVGDVVMLGTGLLVLEAMKMENEIRSVTKGKILSIHVICGKVVEKGEPLVTIERI